MSDSLFKPLFCSCQEEKCNFSPSLFDCIIRRESPFPSSSSFLLSSLTMTNMTAPYSNRNFRDDKCALYFFPRLPSIARRLGNDALGFEGLLYHPEENSG